VITETHNMDIVNSILQHPKIWADIAPRGITAFDIWHKPGLVYHLVGDGDGVIIYNPYRDGVEIHPNILPKHRGKQAYKAVEKSIQMVFGCGIRAIYCEIDPCLRHVTMFARALGFKRMEHKDRDLFVRFKLDS